MSLADEIDEIAGPVAHDAGQRPPVTVTPLGGAGGDKALVGGAFEGARTMDGQLALWRPRLASADVDILEAKETADARSRDVLQNDAYVAGGATLRMDNIVGQFYLLNAKPATRVLFGSDDETWSTEFQAEVEEKFTLYAESLDNWIDASRINNFTSLIRLGIGVHLAGGEMFFSSEWIDEPGRPFRTAIQFIESERISNPPNQVNNRLFRDGVERNARGAPIAYHIRETHPNDYADIKLDRYRWKRVPRYTSWGRPNLVHIYDQRRVAQSRGISEMVTALKDMRISKTFRDVRLQNAVVQSTFAATIESELSTDEVFARLGMSGSGDPDAYTEALNAYYGAYMDQVAQFTAGSKGLTLDGVKIPHLLPNTKLQMRPAGAGGSLGIDFEKSLLRNIAAALGVSYEQLSRDYTDTNYSSARAAMAETWKFMQALKRSVADRMATIIYRLWLEEAINYGQIEALKRRNVPSFYEGLNADAYSQCEWIGASRGQIDELKETEAAVMRIKAGLSTHEYELARLGQDWRKVLPQKAREQQMMDQLGLKLPELEGKNPQGAQDANAQ